MTDRRYHQKNLKLLKEYLRKQEQKREDAKPNSRGGRELGK
jgi:hypothetical protein